jgi:hypothetical protein
MAPVQVRGTVLTVRRVDAYHALTLVAPAIATRFRPGQFVTIAVGGPQTSMLGRRAFAVHDVRPDHGGTVEFVFDARGPGTRWLAALRARDSVDAVGPLGRPFPVPKNPSRCLLLGPEGAGEGEPGHPGAHRPEPERVDVAQLDVGRRRRRRGGVDQQVVGGFVPVLAESGTAHAHDGDLIPDAV